MTLVAKLDEWGHPAWVGLIILSFIFFWPLGFAVLAYFMWSGRMCGWKHSAGRWEERMRGAPRWWQSPPPSGNRAFDEYRAETLRRLEEEQREFREFLDRLRFARDKTEFDQFMGERRNRAGPEPQPQA